MPRKKAGTCCHQCGKEKRGGKDCTIQSTWMLADFWMAHPKTRETVRTAKYFCSAMCMARWMAFTHNEIANDPLPDAHAEFLTTLGQ